VVGQDLEQRLVVGQDLEQRLVVGQDVEQRELVLTGPAQGLATSSTDPEG
jgi:hypothetical protein